jgi:hypothetical protein
MLKFRALFIGNSRLETLHNALAANTRRGYLPNKKERFARARNDCRLDLPIFFMKLENPGWGTARFLSSCVTIGGFTSLRVTRSIF